MKLNQTDRATVRLAASHERTLGNRRTALDLERVARADEVEQTDVALIRRAGVELSSNGVRRTGSAVSELAATLR